MYQARQDRRRKRAPGADPRGHAGGRRRGAAWRPLVAPAAEKAARKLVPEEADAALRRGRRCVRRRLRGRRELSRLS